MSTLTIITQAILEAGSLGIVILAGFGALNSIPRRVKRAINNAFHKRGF